MNGFIELTNLHTNEPVALKVSIIVAFQQIINKNQISSAITIDNKENDTYYVSESYEEIKKKIDEALSDHLVNEYDDSLMEFAQKAALEKITGANKIKGGEYDS